MTPGQVCTRIASKATLAVAESRDVPIECREAGRGRRWRYNIKKTQHYDTDCRALWRAYTLEHTNK